MGVPIFIVGFTAVGKSTYGKTFAKKNNLPFIDLDKLIEEQSGISISTMFTRFGEDYFRKQESEILKTVPIEASVVACGGGTACFFDNMDWMNANGKTIYLKAPLKFILNNIRQSQTNKRPLIKGKSDVAIVAWAELLFAEREPHYLKAQEIIETKHI